MTLLEAALQYAFTRGWKVFPVADDSKKPLTPHGYLDATDDEIIITAWWTAHPNARIGLALRPSGLIAIDIDIADGKTGDETFAKLEQELGPLPRTLYQRSGRNGSHVIMLDPSPGDAGWTNTHANGGCVRGKLGPGVDVKCNGYVLLDPSGSYKWINYGEPQAVPEAWQARLKKSSNSTQGPGIEQWQTSIAPLNEQQLARLRETLGGLARGTTESTTFHAIAIIHHDYGMSVAEGRPLLEEWNNANQPNERHSDRELDRQTIRVASKLDIAGRGERGCALNRLGDDIITLTKGPEPPAPEPQLIDTCHISNFPLHIQLQSKLPMFETPFKQLNDKLGGGFTVHSLNLLIAGVGKGKSSIAGEFAAHHALTQPVIFYVGEMTPVHVAARIIGQLVAKKNPELKLSWLKVLKGEIPIEQMQEAVSSLKLYLVRRSPHPIEAIKQVHKDLVARYPGCTPLLVVDYIQLLAEVGKDMRVSTMQIVRDVQQLIEREQLIGLILSQSSRVNSKRIREGQGNAEDLGDTGAETAELERGATTVMVLSYQSKDDEDEHKVNMVLAKSRFGGGTRLGFVFNGKTGIWTPTDRPHADDAHAQRCEDILLQMTIHEAGKCQNGLGSCGKPMTSSVFRASKKKSAHVVSGNAQAITTAIQDLKEFGKIREVGGCLVLTEAGRSRKLED